MAEGSAYPHGSTQHLIEIQGRSASAAKFRLPKTFCSKMVSGWIVKRCNTSVCLQKYHLDLLDVLAAEVADLYWLRHQDDARLHRLEKVVRRSAPGPDLPAAPPIDHEPCDPH